MIITALVNYLVGVCEYWSLDLLSSLYTIGIVCSVVCLTIGITTLIQTDIK